MTALWILRCKQSLLVGGTLFFMESFIIDKLAWVYLKDGKILMTRSRGKDVCYIGGGKREQGESDEAALMREVEEKTKDFEKIYKEGLNVIKEFNLLSKRQKELNFSKTIRLKNERGYLKLPLCCTTSAM